MLSSAEIGTLIAALGCGIGEGSFDIEKLRYHQIVLMTDADVDGSHIRTLLLTFFYRQMPEIIEKRVPLHRAAAALPRPARQEGRLPEGPGRRSIGSSSSTASRGSPSARARGRRSRATRSSASPSGCACSGARWRRSTGAPTRGIIGQVLHAAPPRQDRAPRAQARRGRGARSSGAPREEEARHLPARRSTSAGRSSTAPRRIAITPRPGAAARPVVIDWNLVDSAEYEELYAIEQDVRSIGPAPYFVREVEHDGKETEEIEIEDADALWDYIDARGRKGMQIQRYKGLGEMNPEQLWETTLDPNTRVMLQVRLDDAVQTDQIFTILMGDQVEPRRQFIEDNALNVKNLDI